MPQCAKYQYCTRTHGTRDPITTGIPVPVPNPMSSSSFCQILNQKYIKTSELLNQPFSYGPSGFTISRGYMWYDHLCRSCVCSTIHSSQVKQSVNNPLLQVTGH